MSRDEAEMEYLKIAQDLDMFGVNYFPITNKKNTEVYVGVTALGLNIYTKENKLTPMTTFPWNEIRNISFDGKKFFVKTNEEKGNSVATTFYSEKARTNKELLDLCVGNHELYMKRRKPDTMEIQQMKAQAKEEKHRRHIERNKLAREKQLREEAEQERANMEKRLMQLQEDMAAANEMLRRSEEAAELLAEKNRVAEEEALLLSHKALEVEQEISRMRLTARKTEEEKNYLERKTQEAELLTARMIEESRKRAMEADKLKNELIHARVAEKEAKEKLLNFLSRTSTESIFITPSSSPETPALGESNTYDLLADGDMDQLSLEIEKERVEYLTRSKQVQNQLKELRFEIEQLKIGESSPLDTISAQQMRLGETKYSTLKKLKSGSTKARVAFFEEFVSFLFFGCIVFLGFCSFYGASLSYSSSDSMLVVFVQYTTAARTIGQTLNLFHMFFSLFHATTISQRAGGIASLSLANQSTQAAREQTENETSTTKKISVFCDGAGSSYGAEASPSFSVCCLLLFDGCPCCRLAIDQKNHKQSEQAGALAQLYRSAAKRHRISDKMEIFAKDLETVKKSYHQELWWCAEGGVRVRVLGIAGNCRQRHKTLIRPFALYGHENWKLRLEDERALEVFERNVLRTIYGGEYVQLRME
ncbi:merlin/moesin/ezrin/radixin [Culex quinquefasciatus]|uniref:Merlin/moesin/ezrin/radixin n=1 Tax=Culex quinquefasciatus TaxID=7176 RepID=B0XK08_CULQU|nr:merlin/moesin/ezrin/radixin [Culex quinquefasciatus]|eukprot:XP_001869980.1 merlin/moesin/ezrin/radixin [Culex quinquefasciatus]